MDVRELRPSWRLLAIRVVVSGLAAAVVGKGAAGVGAVLDYPPSRVFALVFGAVWFVSVLAFAAHFASLQYSLDGRHLSAVSGVLWRRRRQVPMHQIASIEVRQGPLERLLSLGQVWVFTASSGSEVPEVRLHGILRPAAVRDAIAEAVQAALESPPAALLEETRRVRGTLLEIQERLVRIEDALRPGPGGTPCPGGLGTKGAAPAQGHAAQDPPRAADPGPHTEGARR